MRFRLALILAGIVTLFVIASRALAFCTGWCEAPASVLGFPGALVGFVSSHGLAVPVPTVVGWLVTFLVWLVVFLVVGHGVRKAARRD